MPDGFSLKQMSTLLGARIPGFDFYSNEIKPQKIDLSQDLSMNPVPWTTNISGQLDLNLFGACPMVDDKNKIDPLLAEKTVGALLTVNLHHTYPIMMKRAYEISFNSHNVVSEMEKIAESGGFLSSSKIHQLTQSNMNKETFDIKFYDEGGHVRYTDLEKQQITTDAKYEILDKVLQNINATPQFSKDRLPPPRLDRSTGVRFIYENLPCFGYAICYASGFIIGVVDAIFGSTEAISDFKKINDITITHRYNSSSPAYQAVTSTFSGARK